MQSPDSSLFLHNISPDIFTIDSFSSKINNDNNDDIQEHHKIDDVTNDFPTNTFEPMESRDVTSQTSEGSPVRVQDDQIVYINQTCDIVESEWWGTKRHE